MTMPAQSRILPAFAFESGDVLDLTIGFWTMGRLDDRRANAILVCHGASGSRDWALPFCRPGGAFDPERWFIVSIDLPGGGGSSRAAHSAGFPGDYTVRDLARAVAALVDALRLPRLAAFAGPSLASLIGVELAVTRPDLVGALALWNCGIRCDGYARGVVDAIGASLALDGGGAGIRAAVTAFLPSALSRPALDTLDDTARRAMVETMAAGWTKDWRGDELAARYRCVGGGDLPAWHGGRDALAAGIACPTLWLPSSSDMILPADDVVAFTRGLAGARVEICETDRGHIATASPAGSAEFAFYDGRTADFLQSLAA